VCQRALDDHRHYSDPLQQFVEQEVVVGSGFQVGISDLYGKFAWWCKSNGRRQVNSAEFAARIIETTGAEFRRPGSTGRRPRTFVGIKHAGRGP
jgi:hypothetical protein